MVSKQARDRLTFLLDKMDKKAPIFEKMFDANKDFLSNLYPFVEIVEKEVEDKKRAKRRAEGRPSASPESSSSQEGSPPPVEDVVPDDRSRNVVIRGIPEHPEENTVSRRIKRLEMLMKKWFNLDAKIEDAQRVGQIKPRLIVVRFADKKMKEQVLARKKELVKFPGASKIFIDEDLCPNQRNQTKQQRGQQRFQRGKGRSGKR